MKTLRERIEALLARRTRGATVAEITYALDAPPGSVRRVLGRHFLLDGSRWCRVTGRVVQTWTVQGR